MDKLRLGIIGTGSFVREIYQYLYFMSTYKDLIEVVAACDIDENSLSWFSDTYGIDRRYSDFISMIDHEDLDVVAVNTPDHLHLDPARYAFQNGLDVLMPKPLAHSIEDAHEIVKSMKAHGRVLGVDFHKRDDPAVKAARTNYRSGRYGRLQVSTWFMLDRLMVADPNHNPRFFSSVDFAEVNSPISFLTSHMADAFLTISGEHPKTVKATGYMQKLPSLRPVAVDGYDLVDTEVVTEEGSVAHIITGWALPNTAHCLTVQSGRMVCSEGMIDLWNEWYGFREITDAGNEVPNIQFLNFEDNATVTGYGIDNPGKLFAFVRDCRREVSEKADIEASRSPQALGILTALVCGCAEASLEAASEKAAGVVVGSEVDAREFLSERVGRSAAAEYLP